MANCPACGRAVALARERCLYCGAPLGRRRCLGGQPRSAAAPEPGPAQLVLVDLSRRRAADARAGARGLALRGRRCSPGAGACISCAPDARAEAAAEAERLRSLGAQPILVPEAEVRARPCRA